MTGQERTTVIILLSVLVAFAIGYFGLKPMVSAYHNHQLAAGARTVEISEASKRKTALAQLAAQLKKFSRQIEFLRIAVPPEAQYPELLAQLAALASESELVLTTVQPQRSETASESGAAAVVINLTVRGSFPKMISFAEKVEKNLRPITVSSISLIDGGDPQAAEQLTATIQMKFVRTGSVATTVRGGI